MSFKQHEESACHREAVDVMITLPSTTKDIREQLSNLHAADKMKNSKALLQIISVITFFCRQGLAQRGANDETDSNSQLLGMKAHDDPNLASWLKRKESVYTSATIQNEIIKIMGIHVLRDIATCVKASPFFAIMVDEMTDKVNKEQVTLIVRWVAEDFEVREEFLGLYHVNSINAATITDVI